MTAADRPEGVPATAVPTPVTLWVTPDGDCYSPKGFHLASAYGADIHGIPVPRPPRTDPWGLGLSEDEVRNGRKHVSYVDLESHE